MQAIILAAGMGKRLKELTANNTKCMVKVNGVTLIERMLRQLDALKLEKIVMVVGYEGKKLMDYVGTLSICTPVVFIKNPVYDKTNNIYSLFLARECLLQDDTLLLESDLIFEDAVLHKLLDDPRETLALVDKYESWMDGTVVTLDENDNILSFVPGSKFNFADIPGYYKTVNLYKFSRYFSRTHYVPFLEAYTKALGNNAYYEQVLKVITLLEKPDIWALRLDGEAWYEIDDLQDLDIAQSIFTDSKDKLQKMQSRYGGYWRYPNILDFCYLVNPYYPEQRLMDEIKVNFETLLTQYPSGQQVNSLLATKYFGVGQRQICVGNGAAELIKSLMLYLQGKIGIIYPTFEEYPHRKKQEDIVPYWVSRTDYAYRADELMDFYSDKDIRSLLLINPDNPSGNFIEKSDVLRMAKWAQEKKIHLIVDESFVDFAETEEPATLLDGALLQTFPNLVVVKSISKSYGVPGLRLGVLACGDQELVAFIKKDLSIWNINSFAEFYLQIFEKYKETYALAIRRFKESRKDFMHKLSQIKGIRVIPSQANYFMCEVYGRYNSAQLTEQLLDQYHILIKDCASKNGFQENRYIRVAVKTREENDRFAEAVQKLME